MQKIIKAFYAVLFCLTTLLLLTACSTDPIIVDENLEGDLFVLGILSTAAPQQEVRIFKSQPLIQAKDIDNAEVIVTTRSATYRLEHTGDGIYRDTQETIPINQGETYFLTVQIPGDESITAQTTVPSGLEIREPAPTDTLFLRQDSLYDFIFSGQFDIAWRKAANGWINNYFHKTVTNSEWSSQYSVCLLQDSTFRDEVGYTDYAPYRLLGLKIFVSQSDSALSTYSLIQDYYAFTCNEFRDLQDSEGYEEFFRLRNDLRRKHADGAVNVQGAKGVFGSVVVDSVEIAVRIEGEQ
ncbi:MAG: DUF4249 family protein [bacterium]